jgi:hypothetical protein
MMWSVWGSASWVACSHFAQHPYHVGGMHPQWTLVDLSSKQLVFGSCLCTILSRHCYTLHFWIIQVIMACTEIEDPRVLVLMCILVEPLLNVLIRVMINLMCKAEFN